MATGLATERDVGEQAGVLVPRALLQDTLEALAFAIIRMPAARQRLREAPPAWADPEGTWVWELMSCESGRALGTVDELAEASDNCLCQTWRALRAFLQDGTHPD